MVQKINYFCNGVSVKSVYLNNKISGDIYVRPSLPQPVKPRYDVHKTVTKEQAQQEVKKIYKTALPISVGIGILNAAKTALASPMSTVPTTATASIGERITPLLHMVQDLALPTGIVVASWGLIELMLGNPRGKDKLKWSLLGYIGIFIIPEVFYIIRQGFRPDNAVDGVPVSGFLGDVLYG